MNYQYRTDSVPEVIILYKVIILAHSKTNCLLINYQYRTDSVPNVLEKYQDTCYELVCKNVRKETKILLKLVPDLINVKFYHTYFYNNLPTTHAVSTVLVGFG